MALASEPEKINTLRPRQNGRHFADDTVKYIFLNENVVISANISLKFVPKGPINNTHALVQIMAWRRPGDKPLSEPMMVCLLTLICVTRPQCVKADQWSWWPSSLTYLHVASWDFVNVRRMMTSSNGNIFRVIGPLWGEFTVHRWIPLTKASDAELWCFLWSAPDSSASDRYPQQTIEMLVIWDATSLIMTSLSWFAIYSDTENAAHFEITKTTLSYGTSKEI